MALFRFAKGIIEGSPIPVYNKGKMVRDFTYIDDIVEGVVRVVDHTAKPDSNWQPDSPDPATSHAPYRIFNIGNNQPIELMRYIEVLEESLGQQAKLDLLPMQPGDVQVTMADTSDLHNEVGYAPSTPIEVGVERFVEWYKEYYSIG
jgi:UDP-glucuronate 4-epimerase